MVQSKKNRFDRLGFGFAAGLFIPLIIFIAIYLTDNGNVSFSQYLKGLWHLSALIKLLSLCVLGNVLAFWYFLKIKLEVAARGVLGATIFYAFTVLISRLF